MKGKRITITKLDAARRQLRTAIELWFGDGDPVSIHTLAFAAYEVIHFISRKRRTKELLFDSLLVKDEYRRDWHALIKKEANFFKHADRDPDGTIEFLPASSKFFIMFAILGIELFGEKSNAVESTFMFWLYFNEPHYLTDEGRKRFKDGIPAEHLDAVRNLPKHEFFNVFMDAARKAGRL